jgi:nicotinamidase-related amidase
MQGTLRTIQGCVLCVITLLAMLVMAADPSRAQSVIDEWASVKAPPPPELKKVTIDSKKTALLVLDFRQQACTPETRPRCARAVPHVQALLKEARAKGMMVVHTTTTRSTPEDIPAALKPVAGEQVLRTSMDKLTGTDLPEVMKSKGIDTLIITGTSGNGAVLNTVGGAVIRGFKVVVPVDTMPADGPYQEQFAIWQIANGPTVREMSTITRSDIVSFK